jgi:hypothetical protein
VQWDRSSKSIRAAKRGDGHTLRGAGYQRVSKTFAGALGRSTVLPEVTRADLGTVATTFSCSCCACASSSAYLRARSRSSGGGFHPGPSSQYQNTAPLCGPSGSQGHLPLCPFTPMQLIGGLACKLPSQWGADRKLPLNHAPPSQGTLFQLWQAHVVALAIGNRGAGGAP